MVIHDWRAARPLFGWNAIRYSVAIGNLRQRATCKLGVDAFIGFGKDDTIIITNHIQRLVYLHVVSFVCFVRVNLIDVFVLWCGLAFQLQEGKVCISIIGCSEQVARFLHEITPRIDIVTIIGDTKMRI